MTGYHARWDIVTQLISLKVDGSAKSCLRDKRVIPLTCITMGNTFTSTDNQGKIHIKYFCKGNFVELRNDCS